MLKIVRTAAIAAILLFCAVGCSAPNKIANYKVTPNGYVVWRYTKVDGQKKDILSTGDTLVTTVDSIYVVRKQCINNRN